MFIPNLGFNLFHPGSGSASASKNLSFLTLKTVSKLSEKWSGSRPDQDSYFFLIPDPDPWSKDRIPDPDQQHCSHHNEVFNAECSRSNKGYLHGPAPVHTVPVPWYVRYCDFCVWYKVLILFLTQFCEPAHYFVRGVVSHAYTNIAD